MCHRSEFHSITKTQLVIGTIERKSFAKYGNSYLKRVILGYDRVLQRERLADFSSLCLACFGSPDPYVDLPISDRISVECCTSLGADVVLFGFVL